MIKIKINFINIVLLCLFVTGQFLFVNGTILKTGKEMRDFLGGRTGKMVYTKYELPKLTYYKTGRSLCYLDFSDDTLIEREVVRFTDCEPRNPVVSADGKWITYNTCNTDNNFTDHSKTKNYICRFMEHADTSNVVIANGAQPHWWIRPGTQEEYILYTGCDIEECWQSEQIWPPVGNTYMQRIVNKRPYGSVTQLLPWYSNGGRSKAGGWIFTSSRATGVYQITPGSVSNATILSQNHFDNEGCNPSVSPHARDAEVMFMHLGVTHEDFFIRNAGGQIIWRLEKATDDGNAYWDTPEWSSDTDYCAVVGSPGDCVAPFDNYLVRISDKKVVRVQDGNYQYPYLWVGDSLRAPLEMLYPNGSENLFIGDSIAITWKADTNQVTQCGLRLSIDSGKTYMDISGSAIASNSPEWRHFGWRIPDSLKNISLVSTRCRMQVYSKIGKSLSDASDQNFSIEPSLYLLPQAFGSTVSAGDEVTVRWAADTSRVKACGIKLISDGVEPAVVVADSISLNSASWGNYTLTIPDSLTKNTQGGQSFKIVVYDVSGDLSASTGTVTIASQPSSSSPSLTVEKRKGFGVCGTGAGLAFIPPIGFRLAGLCKKKKHVSPRGKKHKKTEVYR